MKSYTKVQRWSPRGHTFKSLAWKPQVLKNCPVRGSRTTLFFEWLKFWRSAEKCFSRPFFLKIDRNKFFKTFFLRKTLAFVSLVLGLGLEHSCSWTWPRIFFVSLALATSLVSSIPSLLEFNKTLKEYSFSSILLFATRWIAILLELGKN